MLSCSSAIMALDECRRWKTRKCIAIAIALCYLENTPSHINKNRELFKERGRKRQRERYKTTDLITEYNHFVWECSHVAHPVTGEQKKCWHMLGKKFDWFRTGRKIYANIMQHKPTWYTNERNMYGNRSSLR